MYGYDAASSRPSPSIHADPMKKIQRLGLLAPVLMAAHFGAFAQAPTLASLADLDLEQLSNLRVTSASKREERVVDAAASIFVITAEDIRRSGATSLSALLRLAPNLVVVAGDGHQSIKSARGGLAGTANKMLVLIDGRTIYTPLFSGVFTDALALMLEDVDRIEVISGPGSTLWGTNAVNGVINVISKPGRDTRGGLLAAVAGNKQRGASLRHGWEAGGGDLRVYGRYFDRDENRLASGASARDSGERGQVGFRGDWARGAGQFTLQGDAYSAEIDNLGGLREASGGNVLGRFTRRLGEGSSYYVQAYVDRSERMHTGSFDEERTTVDIEAQHQSRPWDRHQFAWGGGYRASRDRTIPTSALGFMPPARTLHFASLFVQDEMRIGEKLRATVGLRAERNDYTGVEWLPNVRLAYNHSPDTMLWSALTRTVRSPSRIDRDLTVPGFPPFVIAANDSFHSEVANVAEVGFRGNLGGRSTLSFTAFHHRFKELRTLEPGDDGLRLANGAHGRVSGLEGWGDLRVTPTWRLVAGFLYQRITTGLDPGSVNLTEPPLGNNPRRTASLRSQWNVTPSVQLDLFARYVGAMPNPAVPSYSQLNARLGWQATRDLELSFNASNLLDREHAEFGAPAARAVFTRGYFVKAAWSF